MSLENYTPNQRRHMAAALEKAKAFLWDGQRVYGYGFRTICLCLCQVSGMASSWARFLIHERLGDEITLEHWLARRGIPWSELTDARVQAHRLAWMDVLIAELRGK